MKKCWIQVIVLFLLLLLFSQLNISEYIISMKKLSLNIWLTLIGLQGLSFFLLLVQWKRIGASLGQDLTFNQMISVNMKGVFYETITPGLKVGGEVAKAYSLINEAGFSSAQASALVVIQKSISIFALVLLSLVSFIFLNSQVILPEGLLLVAYLAMGLILILLILILFLPERLNNYLSKSKSRGKLKDFLGKYIQAINEMKRKKSEIFFQLIISFIIWILFPLKLYYITNSLGLELTFIRTFVITIISYIAGMAPLLPGGLGSFEATMIGIFLLWGISKDQGLVIATLFRFTTFWLIFFISIIYLTSKKVYVKWRGVSVNEQSGRI